MYIVWDRSLSTDLGCYDDFDDAVAAVIEGGGGVVFDDTRFDDQDEPIQVYEAWFNAQWELIEEYEA